jgi:sugar/nucleoside kinase (ribokinase family)
MPPPPATPLKTITIIGSLNIDFITRTPRLPHPGETLAANSFTTGHGGKGANQAIAAARLSAAGTATARVAVRMVGRVGADDSFGADYIARLEREGVDASGVRELAGEMTGVTNIVVEEEGGENRILFVANANAKFGAGEDLVGGSGVEGGDVVVFQLEIPVETVSFFCFCFYLPFSFFFFFAFAFAFFFSGLMGFVFFLFVILLCFLSRLVMQRTIWRESRSVDIL